MSESFVDREQLADAKERADRFDRFVRDRQDILVRFLRRQLPTDEDAQDVAQVPPDSPGGGACLRLGVPKTRLPPGVGSHPRILAGGRRLRTWGSRIDQQKSLFLTAEIVPMNDAAGSCIHGSLG